jgi:segregation and condensation protein B
MLPLSSADDKPFRAIVPPPDAAPFADEPSEAAWSADELEAAYQRALQAAEEAAPSAVLGGEPPLEGEDSRADLDGPEAATASASGAAATTGDGSPSAAPRIHPRQIIEVFLFVGGRPLTARQFADLIGERTSPEDVERWIAELNDLYRRQRRPYEILLTAGGYHLQLHPEFEKVRARVYGVGPREVKLAQGALEVLALVAYRQPLTRAAVEEAGIPGAAALLRQLLRRQLISLERADEGGEPTYRTTPRFLELFGLRSLADLPRPELIAQR